MLSKAYLGWLFYPRGNVLPYHAGDWGSISVRGTECTSPPDPVTIGAVTRHRSINKDLSMIALLWYAYYGTQLTVH